MSDSTYFPFSAIVGQPDMKEALLCNAVDPGIGGVLISGTRGTAKSTAARSLAHLLPEIRAVADCPYHCPPDEPDRQCPDCVERDLDGNVEEIPTPFVTLPLGATEDRVLGTIDLEAAIQEGERSFEPGLLARANRGILYVDEVNLLGDHLVDVLLDAVATGTNRVEREGVSVEHPADVLLVGTMNPEEGKLRPQLLDRFGLSVEMDRGLAPDDRKAVVRRRAAFEDDPESMLAEWRDEEAALAARIADARAVVEDVTVGDDALDRIVEHCVEADVDGLRADIVIHRTARALAALDGEQAVATRHVDRAAELALGHRSQSPPDRGGPDRPGDDGDDEADRAPPDDRPSPTALPGHDPGSEDAGGDGFATDGTTAEGDGDGDTSGAGADTERVFPIAGGVEPPRTEATTRTTLAESTGRTGAARAITDGRQGAYVRARRPQGRVTDPAIDATIRAAAPHQAARRVGADEELSVHLRPADLREKERRARARTLVVFVVDSSGSMAAYERMSAVKGAILSLLEGAYQDRNHVSLIGFRGNRAEVVLPPTSSVARAARELPSMPTGGRTPLAAGLQKGLDLVAAEDRAHSGLVPLLVVVTDGRSNVAEGSPVDAALERADRIRAADVSAMCLDTETGPVRMGLVRQLADRMGATYHRLDELEPSSISSVVRDVFYGDSRAAG